MNGDAIFFACDPKLNTKCPKRFRDEFCCEGGYAPLCDGTFDQMAARRHEDGTPITHKEWSETHKIDTHKTKARK